MHLVHIVGTAHCFARAEDAINRSLQCRTLCWKGCSIWDNYNIFGGCTQSGEHFSYERSWTWLCSWWFGIITVITAFCFLEMACENVWGRMITTLLSLPLLPMLFGMEKVDDECEVSYEVYKEKYTWKVWRKQGIVGLNNFFCVRMERSCLMFWALLETLPSVYNGGSETSKLLWEEGFRRRCWIRRSDWWKSISRLWITWRTVEVVKKSVRTL